MVPLEISHMVAMGKVLLNLTRLGALYRAAKKSMQVLRARKKPIRVR
ncbi:hypothetical protein KKI24_19035 [bacterium]|nr:hypothetical protein [bacterium]